MDTFAAIRPLIARVQRPESRMQQRDCALDERYCKSCDTVKSLSEFYLSGRITRDGRPAHSYRCKSCDIRRMARG
jgi:hypothetical protein